MPDFAAENQALTALAETMNASPGAVLQRLVELAIELTRSDSAGISLLEPGGEHGTFRWVATAGAWARYCGGTMPREQSPCGEVIARQTLLLLKEPERAFPALRQAEPGIVEGLLAPFDVDGKPGGTVWTIKHGPDNPFEAEDARLLQSLARFASAAHQMVRVLGIAEAAKAHSDEKYRTLFDSIDEGFAVVEVILDENGKPFDLLHLEANKAYERHTGLHDIVGKRSREIIPEAGPWLDFYGDVALTGQPARSESYLAPPVDRWIAAYATRFGGEGSLKVAIVFNDITERKRAEETLRESEQRQAFLLKLSDALRALTDPIAIQEVAARILGEHLDADRTYYAVVKGDYEAAIVEREYLRGDAPSVVGTHAFAAFGSVFDAFRNGRAMVVDDLDMADAIRSEELSAFRALSIRSIINVPLVKGDRSVAGMNVLSVTPRKWTAQQVSLVEETAERTWAAVERARAEHALRESEERFRTLAESIDDVFYMTDLDQGALLYLSPSFERVWGRPSATLRQDLSGFIDTIHPDDRHIVTAGQTDQQQGKPVASEYRIIRADGAIRWIYDRCFPVEGAGARRSAGVASDITERKATETALRESEERFRQFGEASQDVLWMRNAETFQWEYLTPAFETIYGLDREAALRGDNMTGWLELVLPEDRDHASESLNRVRDGAWVTFEYRVRRPVDGEVRWLRNTDFPIRDASGKVVRIGGIGHDITELKRTEEALAAAEVRQRTLMEGVPQLVWRSCDKGLWSWASPQWLDFTGQGQEESRGLGWLDAVHPGDHAATMQAWEEARPHGILDVKYRVRRAADGAWLWHHTRSRPVRDAAGRILEWLGTSTDIQHLRELQDQQQVLVAELQHRTRNLMGVVRSMSDKTAKASADLPDFRRRFGDRLEALSRVQGLLSRLNEHDRVTFDELIETELAAMDGAADRVSLDGPRGVRLRSSMVQILAMAVHELATNAVKYGALKQPQGKLSITWSLNAEVAGERPRLHIDWRESSVTMPDMGSKPAGSGQGRELIERALPYQLNAKTTYELGPEGVHCTISIPISTTTAHGAVGISR